MALDEKAIRKIVNEVLDAKINKLLAPILKSINSIEKQHDDIKSHMKLLEDSNEKYEKEVKDLKKEVSMLNNELTQLKVYCDDQEQYVQRKCAKVHGVPTSQHKDTTNLVLKTNWFFGWLRYQQQYLSKSPT